MQKLHSPETRAQMVRLLEKETGINADSIPYYDPDIYSNLSPCSKNSFMPPDFFCVNGNRPIYSFSDLCRVVGVCNYFYALNPYYQRMIAHSEENYLRLPYCDEEFEELCGLYYCEHTDIPGYIPADGFNELFCAVSEAYYRILYRDDVHDDARNIAALQWYAVNRGDEFLKCRLKVMTMVHRGLNERDGFLFFSVHPLQSGLEKTLWFHSCSGTEKDCEPYYLEGDDLQTASRIYLGKSQLNPYLKELILWHWGHEITDSTLRSGFIDFRIIEKKEAENK